MIQGFLPVIFHPYSVFANLILIRIPIWYICSADTNKWKIAASNHVDAGVEIFFSCYFIFLLFFYFVFRQNSEWEEQHHHHSIQPFFVSFLFFVLFCILFHLHLFLFLCFVFLFLSLFVCFYVSRRRLLALFFLCVVSL